MLDNFFGAKKRALMLFTYVDRRAKTVRFFGAKNWPLVSSCLAAMITITDSHKKILT